MKNYFTAVILALVAIGNFAYFSSAFDIFYTLSRPNLSQHAQDKLNTLIAYDSNLVVEHIARFGPAANTLISLCGALGNKAESLPERFIPLSNSIRSYCQSTNPEYEKDRNDTRLYQIWYVKNSERKSIAFTIANAIILVAIFISYLLARRSNNSIDLNSGN